MQALIEKIIPAYPYTQYNADPNIVAFFTAYNTLAQGISTTSMRLICRAGLLPPSRGVAGLIALGIYGEGRPLLQISEDAIARGAYNTIEYNAIPYAGLKNYVPGSASYVPDDYFKRILTGIFIKVTARTFVSTGSSAAWLIYSWYKWHRSAVAKHLRYQRDGQ